MEVSSKYPNGVCNHKVENGSTTTNMIRAPIGSVRFRFKPNRYRTDCIGIGIGIYRNFGFGFYRLPIPISKIPKPKPKYRS